jgi:Metallo-beta-lactamase superfamily
MAHTSRLPAEASRIGSEFTVGRMSFAPSRRAGRPHAPTRARHEHNACTLFSYDRIMNETTPVFRIGAATITRIFETAFTLPPSALLPAWHDSHGACLAQHLSPASLDLPGNRVTLQTHLWVVEIDGLAIVIDTGIGNGKSRAFSALFDRLDNPVLARLAAAGFDRKRVDYAVIGNRNLADQTGPRIAPRNMIHAKQDKRPRKPYTCPRPVRPGIDLHAGSKFRWHGGSEFNRRRRAWRLPPTSAAAQ